MMAHKTLKTLTTYIYQAYTSQEHNDIQIHSSISFDMLGLEPSSCLLS